MKKESQAQRYGYWRPLVEEHQQSGLSQKEFCKQRKLVLSQFVYYRCQIMSEAPQFAIKATSFVPVKVSGEENIIASGEIKLSLPNGFQCSFPVQIDAPQLKRLVEVLLSC